MNPSISSPATARTALVTGGARGIGHALSIALGEAGFRVAVHYHRSQAEAETLVRQLHQRGIRAAAFGADLRVPDEVVSLFQDCKKRLGSVDVLVNNAGESAYGVLQDIRPTDWQALFAINVHAVFYCTQQAIGPMIAQQWGRIINISSMWGLVGASCESLYSATKGAVLAFTKACAKELAYSGITVNAIAPGAVRTEMTESLSEATRSALLEEVPLGRWIEPEEIAAWVVQLAGPAGAAITGQVISPNGGLVIT